MRKEVFTLIWKAIQIISIIAIAAIFASECKAQFKSKNEIIAYVLQFVGGGADGINQALQHHHLGRGNRFWDYNTSWMNKYKNFPTDKREAYFLSKSILVGTTDGYHLTRTVAQTAIFASIGFELGVKDRKFDYKSIIKKVLLSTLVNRIGFVLFYNGIYGGHY